MQTHRHVPNGLRGLDENGHMVCAICGQGYDEQPRANGDWSVCDECKARRHDRCRMPISAGFCCCAD